jgi:hypothetical protein
MHLVGVATVLSTIALAAAPVSSATAATTAPAVGRTVTVVPQTFVTTGPSTFINYNSQTSAGPVSSGVQTDA